MQKLIKDFDIPNKKIETWKFTDLKKIFEKNIFEPLSTSIKNESIKSNVDTNVEKNIFFDPNINFVIFENGFVKKINIQSKNLEIKPTKIASKKQIIDQKNFSRNDSLLEINETFLNDNLLIKIKKGTKLKEPISIFYYNSEKKNYLINNRINVIAEKDTEAVINEIFISNNKAIYWNNVHSYICLEQNSKLEHYKIQLEGDSSIHSSSSSVNCNSSSIYNNFIFSIGGSLSRIEVNSSINSSDINFNIKGLYLAKTNQHHDITTVMQHKHPESKSNQHIKGILQKNSSGVFQGKVIVSQDAQKTDAFQFNQNLLLSESAEANAKPELEIYADDVKCSHGATTGELDEQMLFYLRSRGLNKEEAQKVLIEGFINELFDEIKNSELKKKLLLTSKKNFFK
ncbi:MAG: FeS cluster assembly protein SufD [Alphaproteobacteria bacterium MarineAlpha6_Bin4]|nr:MAG: FeS cluster assembly protein SufD [Alphaproteobacteria bacterium MarineAlpha6_Bin4]|tara:strand:+ start:2206 stop:3402 length:1197 start_codon:yes stop_codon:yes gene_type:complete